MTDETPKKQPLWPLFMIATALGVFGFVMAFYGPVRTSDPQVVATPERSALRIEQKDDPISPTFILKPNEYSFFIFQKTVREEATLESKMSFDATDTVEDGKVSRRLSNVRIEMTGADLAETSMEVARLVETLELELTFGPNGELKSQTVVSAEAGQLARVVELIKAAQSVLVPAFPGGPISPKREWTDVINVKPTHGVDEELFDVEEVPSVSGHVSIKRRLVGTDNDHGFIQQTVTQSILVADEPKPSARVSGAGTAVVNKTDGAVVYSRMNLQTSFNRNDEHVVMATEFIIQAK